MEQQTIAIGCDHAGYDYKEAIAAHLSEAGYLVLDMGTHSSESVDYPDFVHPVAEAIEQEKPTWVCSSVVLQTVWPSPPTNTSRSGSHRMGGRTGIAGKTTNNANVICLPARFISQDLAVACVDTFLQSRI